MCRIVFSSRKKTLKKGEMVHRKFVLSEETFVFGPLLCGKTRERWRERANCTQTDVRCSGLMLLLFPAGIVRVATQRTWRH